LVVAPSGDLAGPLPDDVIEALRTLQPEIQGRASALREAKVARQLARDAEANETAASLGDKAPVLFWKDTDKNGYLSNWAKSPFQLDGHTFNCAEQYLMWSKAVVMGDKEKEQQILSTNDPQRQKELGREVRPWRDGIWKRHRDQVMLRAARAKFMQNAELGQRLLKTYPRLLAEASPSDCTYGIGLAPNNPQAQDPRNWKGENLLGRTLERVRAELKEACTSPSEPLDSEALVTVWPPSDRMADATSCHVHSE